MHRQKIAKTHILFLLCTIIVFIWSAIKPHAIGDWFLEVTPAVVGIIIIVATYNRFRLTTLSYFIISILAILMFIGGHYTYSKVPLFNWLKDHFDLQRNHYDRFGHFLKGMLVIFFRELLLKTTPLTKGKWLFLIALCMSLASSAFYEIIEWGFSKIAHGGKTAEDFLGTQGDIWDAQWDMALDLIGSILSYLFLAKLHNRQLKRQD